MPIALLALTCQATLASQSHGGIFVLEAESPAVPPLKQPLETHVMQPYTKQNMHTHTQQTHTHTHHNNNNNNNNNNNLKQRVSGRSADGTAER